MSSNDEANAAPRVRSNDEVIAAPRYPGLMVMLIGVVVAGGLAAFGIWSRSDTVAESEAGGGRWGDPPCPAGLAQARAAAPHADPAG